MNKEPKSEDKTMREDSASGLESREANASPSRRKFTRQAIVGSGVLFSLGNRPAWSQTDSISDPLHTSWTNGTSSSHHPGADYSDYTVEIIDEESELTTGWCKPETADKLAEEPTLLTFGEIDSQEKPLE
jgi:hypothetical protein